ncbi:TIR domain-containing protein [Sinorhizobium meliloti]|nr:TIR domain-containing protein [Sinorhizobium meliloti]MDX0252579.1 TIR domain-containing protein [Sinorhizobium meliloti]
MAYLKQFEYDIFISYAHHDNAGEEAWVSRFVDDLIRALKQRIPLASDLNIFFDTQTLRGNEELDEVPHRAPKAALFVPIVTPSYVTRKWTLAELAMFTQGSDHTKRIFAVDALPLDSEDEYPPVLRSLIRGTFWRRASNGVALPIDRNFNKELYVQKIAKLAEGIKSSINLMRGEGPLQKTPVATVLLAQVTPDLEFDRELVRSYLEQYNIAVVPVASYPGGGKDFAAAVKADCGCASHFIQLLGPYSDRRPSDLQEGYSCHQYDAAKAAGLVPLLWCRPDLNSEVVKDHKDIRLFKAPELLAIGIEQFKAEIVRIITTPVTKMSIPRKAFVFVDSDRSDMQVARDLALKIESRQRPAFLPLFDGSPEEILRDLQDTIIDCSALVIVYGHAQPPFVRAQIRLSEKLMPQRGDKPLKLLAVYSRPPAAKDKLGVLSQDIIWMDAQPENDSEIVEDLIRRLEA